MANLFLNLPAPASNTAGAAVDVTTLGATKTVVVKGNGSQFEPFVVIEISCDASAPTNWTPLTQFTTPGEKTFNVACNFMRARVTNYTQGGAPTVDVGSTDIGTQTATLVATAGNGSGAGVDISALGDYTTVQVSGTYKGAVNIEVSNDGGTSWGPANMSFVQGAAPMILSTVIVANFMRVTRAGIQDREPNPGLPVIHVCGSELAGGGGGGGGGGNRQTFSYEVTGSEPDLAALIITLPDVRTSASYAVFPAQGDCTAQLGMNVEEADKTTADFVLTLSSDATAGDVFWFNVIDPT